MSSDSPQLFFQDLTGRLLVLAVCAGLVLHRPLFVCWFSLYFVLNSSCCSSEWLGLYFIFAFIMLMIMYYLKNIVLCFSQAIRKVCILWHDYYNWCFIIALLNVLFREKFLRLTMGFGYFMYSHSLVPVIDLWNSGRDIRLVLGINLLIGTILNTRTLLLIANHALAKIA